MITLHIDVTVAEDNRERFLEIYRSKYVPAISRQEGFVRTMLIQGMQNPNEFEIDIFFQTEALRQRWANSQDHAEVWPLIEALADELSWKGFNVIE
ncbi:MAG: antibiotic biosynthesis monooxygenase [Alicyclobacillus macrosporangiidus]|uniref:antibiotic biosynthesis monooxygenase family protein n=1 Tax=Alicyclobacillus macrosporangiidus TaxID=392015 RepID=UPI0026EB068A|nr:antibiotic biosynthesis monooxygenase [Alicyclobacillus macrosporangiidus]MCL6600718.1 antibiotic biosynthesis monooxygenase [Alicyclobacillus macrosporangiidus]